MNSLKALRIYVYGRVQRIGYRRYVANLAQETGLKGYVRNLSNGSVEILVQGNEEELKKFMETNKNPPLSNIRQIKVEETIVQKELKKSK